MRLSMKVLIGAPAVLVLVLVAGYALRRFRVAQAPVPRPFLAPLKCQQPFGTSGVILSASDAAEVYGWRCPLGGRGPIEGWVPAPEDVARLETQLPAYWQSQGQALRVKALDSYIRQYAGFIADGHKGICVNLVDREILASDAVIYRSDPALRARLPRGIEAEDVWRCGPLGAHAIGGGIHFCGVTFDLDPDRMSDLHCNGS